MRKDLDKWSLVFRTMCCSFKEQIVFIASEKNKNESNVVDTFALKRKVAVERKTLGVDFTGSGCGTAVANTPWDKKLVRSWVRILPDIGFYSVSFLFLHVFLL